MKHFRIKRLYGAIAAACLLVSGITVFAGSTDFFVSGGKMEADYTDYQDMEKAQAELGYGIDSVERFENGYVFEGVSIDTMTAYSEENGAMYSVPSMDVRYRKARKLIDLIVSESEGGEATGIRAKEPNATRACGDIMLRYDEYTNMMVPEGYELTEEDKQNEKRDDFHIVYQSVTVNGDETAKGQTASDDVKRGSYYVSEDGADVSVTVRATGENWQDWTAGGEPYMQQLQIVSWEKDDKFYYLSGAELEMGANELFDMAEELIGAR